MKRIAVIGCGAIADSFHIPALKSLGPECPELVLVDPDPARRAALGTKHGVERHAASHTEVADRIDAAIIASPHATHVPIAKDLVRAGVPVLSEKPLGTSVSEVEELIELASGHEVIVAVNQTRRFIPACRKIKEILERGELGDSVEIEIREGDRFDWPAATPSMFGARSGGKGVLLDIGAHVLDLAVWWFGTDLEVSSYVDDSFGGSEASSSVSLRGPSCRIDIRLSWLAKQENTCRFSGDRGTLIWNVYDLEELQLTGPGGGGRSRKVRVSTRARSFADLGGHVLEDFLRAVRSGEAPEAAARDVLPSIRLIEECYAGRTTYDMPWHHFEMGAGS